MDDQERDELLIELKSDVKWIKQNLENHLAHHFKYSFFAWSSVIGLIITLTILLLNLKIK